MAHRLLLLVPLLLSLAPPARSGTFNLSWDNCWSEGAVLAKDFACQANTGQQVLVGSFVPAVAHPACTGFRAVVELETGTGTIPDWWQVASGGCRQRTVSASFDFSEMPQTSCVDAWQGAALGILGTRVEAGTEYPPGTFSPDKLVFTVDAGLPEPVPLQSGVEYYAFKLLISNGKATGSDACLGCDVGACIAPYQLGITEADPLWDPCYDDQSIVLSWQCAHFSGGIGCVAPGDCGVPARTPTWGAIKSLYR
jgi:hypothetical protein